MSAVTEFFEAIEMEWRRSWGISDPRDALLLDDPTHRGLCEYDSVRRPGLHGPDVLAHLETLRFGSAGTESYRELLEYGSCGRLGYGDFVLTNTRSFEEWTDSLSFGGAPVDDAVLLPVGIDENASLICLHRVGEGPPVISLEDEGRLYVGLFSSFEAMLNVLAEMVRSDVILYVERGCRPTPEQRALAARLCAMDPSGFGAVGWPQYFESFAGGIWSE
jgi:hypothetical protein